MDLTRGPDGPPAFEEAVARGFAFLARGAFAEGEIALTCRARGGEVPDRSLFGTALAMLALGRSPAPLALEFHRRAAHRLEAAREPGGVWRFWPPGHSRHDSIPPDLEDTACAALALAGAGVDPGVDIRTFAMQKEGDGSFRTWIVAPGSPFAEPGHPFWRESEARWDDVDAGANAQAVAFVAAWGGGDLVRGAARWLLDVVRSGEEVSSDKWYRSAAFVRYLIVRAAAAAPGLAPARETIAAAIRRDTGTIAAGESVPELAVSLTTARACGIESADVAPITARLLALQQADGGFARAPVWYGGPKRSVDWGSRELSTVFAIEALEGALSISLKAAPRR